MTGNKRQILVAKLHQGGNRLVELPGILHRRCEILLPLGKHIFIYRPMDDEFSPDGENSGGSKPPPYSCGDQNDKKEALIHTSSKT